MKSPKGWSRRFDAPIALSPGRALVTLEDAARYIQELPAGQHEQQHWRNAVEALLVVVEGNGDPMLARIAMMQALGRDRPAEVPQPRRKRAKRYRIVR